MNQYLVIVETPSGRESHYIDAENMADAKEQANDLGRVVSVKKSNLSPIE